MEVFFQHIRNGAERLLKIFPERRKHWRVGRVTLHLSVNMKQEASAIAAWVVHRVLGVLENLGLWFS